MPLVALQQCEHLEVGAAQRHQALLLRHRSDSAMLSDATPPYGVLTFNAGKTVPDSGKHYFAVYYIKAPDEKKAPRATWADHKGEPEGTKRLYIDFKKEEKK
ncbi:hypothetical protein ANCCEY_01113 [Ancylostoma ceylanicum]|uniref:Uncharacterized protein n=1 Tax=Ancylostoma ceylanicum TaxID=53326 RepID=A0A0D6M6F8_9BILA|nr:hypothetical protein ANCCEY_01113 [Ancylostoma ceylanicum]